MTVYRKKILSYQIEKNFLVMFEGLQWSELRLHRQLAKWSAFISEITVQWKFASKQFLKSFFKKIKTFLAFWLILHFSKNFLFVQRPKLL